MPIKGVMIDRTGKFLLINLEWGSTIKKCMYLMIFLRNGLSQ